MAPNSSMLEPESASITGSALQERFGGRWQIAHHADLSYWTAEHTAGTAIRYLAAQSPAVLAAMIETAEAGS